MIDLRKLTLETSLLRSGYRSGDFTPAEVIREIYRRIRARQLRRGEIRIRKVSRLQSGRAREQL